MMQFKIKILKNISPIIVFFASVLFCKAQETKVDGVAVVVGQNIVLESDIEKFKKEIEIKTEGKLTITDCEMLEELMQRKLLAHHAVIDSVTVSQGELDGSIEGIIRRFSQEFGGDDQVVKAYGFNNMTDLKKELQRIQREALLMEKEQKKIVEDVDVTPEEVRVYFNGLKEKDELPEIPAEVQLAQLVLYAEASKEENDRVVAQLNKIRRDIDNGASFEMKAIINSEDPSVSRNSGNMGAITKDSPLVKEFKEVLFSMDEGEISEPFKTLFGYHIIKLHKIRGRERIASHILMQPEISDTKLQETKDEIKEIVDKVKSGELTFDAAVRKFSEDKDTKLNGGLLMNPYSGEPTFELTRLPPDLFGRISELKKNDLSDVFYDETRGGEKMYKVIFMKDRTDTHTADLVKDYVKMQKFALAKKREETIEKWSKEKIQETYIKLGNDYKKCNFKNNWKKDNK